MVYVNAFLMRAESNAVLWVYIDHATRARRRAITTRDAAVAEVISIR